jgi:ABC-type lipoprotein release transport system permease subunit
MEGGLIGLLGGLVGVGGAYVAGIIIEQIAGSFEPELLASGGIFRMPWDYVVLWIGISVGVSVIAALYPAARASRVDPVEALRGA